MTEVFGNAEAQAAFVAALRSGALHHAWLLVGPEGVGKARFAQAAALRMLAEASATGVSAPGLIVPEGHPTRALVDAGSHPDLRVLHRLPKDAEKPDQDFARSITIAQVRSLQPMFATTPSMGARRAVIIDAADDLERNGANALLKNLEEPPVGTIFLLVSHAPGRLLPTIRSRCRVLRFGPLDDGEMGDALRTLLPDADAEEIGSLIASGEGSPGRAIRYAGLDVQGLDRAIVGIAQDGDPMNARRAALAKALAGKGNAARYEAFLDRVPAMIAREARTRSGARLKTALDAQAAARDLAGAAMGLSLDAQATVFEMMAIVATLR
ncbi:DNA polymerase III subunit delta' [Sphingomonas sp. RP10(2022)]|uniref:DNA polymerase III subunit delta n=1 Tax=Sphingomonas liriopis TaxID=2949094 RepID=A0A9X2KNG2_9SPHN|nr:DNA polymerase III subunit delta' [Sphingomonas liriopis]